MQNILHFKCRIFGNALCLCDLKFLHTSSSLCNEGVMIEGAQHANGSHPALVAGILWTETGSMTSMDRETKRRPSGVAWPPAARWACRAAQRRLREQSMRRASRSRKSSWWEGAVARPCGLIKLLKPRRNVADGTRRVRLFQRMGLDADSCLVCDRATWAFFSAANKEVICASPP